MVEILSVEFCKVSKRGIWTSLLRCDPWEGNTGDRKNKTDLCCSESWVLFLYLFLFLPAFIQSHPCRSRQRWEALVVSRTHQAVNNHLFPILKILLIFFLTNRTFQANGSINGERFVCTFYRAMQMQCLVSCWPLMFEHCGVIKTDINICVFYRPIIVWGFEMSFSNPLRGRGGMESLSVSKQLG